MNVDFLIIVRREIRYALFVASIQEARAERNFVTKYFSLFLSLLLIVACSAPVQPKPSYGDAIRIYNGNVEGYQSESLTLGAYNGMYSSRAFSFGGGTLNSNGQLDFEFKADIPEDELTSSIFGCWEEDFEKVLDSSLIIFGITAIAGGYDVGTLELVKLTPKDKTQAGVGDAGVQWLYSTRAYELKHICNNGTSFDLSIKPGWNTIIVTYKGQTGDGAETGFIGSIVSIAPSSEFFWVYTPYRN
jgi:hypothetical protein